MKLDFYDLVEERKLMQGIVGLCHGCFDIIHVGHIRHFRQAKKHCDVLIVTITDDKYINKGPGRPVFNSNERIELLDEIKVIDYVSINKWSNAMNTIRLLKPNLYIKGIDYNESTDRILNMEVDAIKSVGGSMIYTTTKKYSSTEVLNGIFR
jgi:rfaE bifunctional protein nucleotidyltransferase chain/domain